MQTLDEYIQANQDDILDILENEIDNMQIPHDLRTRFISLLFDNAADVLEYNYNNMISAQICRAYDEYKDSKL